MKARLAELGGTVAAGSPADFGKLIAEETEKWGKVVKFAVVTADCAISRFARTSLLARGLGDIFALRERPPCCRP